MKPENPDADVRDPNRCRVCRADLRVLLEIPEAPARVQTLLAADDPAEDPTFRLALAECVRCGLVQLRETPDWEFIYDDDYGFSVNFSQHAREYQRALADRWVADRGLAGREILEVGGGDGFFAALLAERGARVTMIEPSRKGVERARERGGFRVERGRLGPDILPGRLFDAVVARHVLEHLEDPIDFLTAIAARLRPDGELLVEVPNLDGVVRGGRPWDFYAEHSLYFQPSTLALALERSGFEVCEFGLLERGDYLWAAARPGRTAVDDFAATAAERAARLRAMVRQAIDAGRSVAFWGAGGRCVALLALAGGRELGFDAVVDSDPAKWGRFTPGSRLRVIPPSEFHARDVDDVVVGAEAFEAEIVRGLRDWRRARPGRRIGTAAPEPRWFEDREAEARGA